MKRKGKESIIQVLDNIFNSSIFRIKFLVL